MLTKRNGSQHAIVVLGQHISLDLEDLAGPTTRFPTSHETRILVITLAIFWILLLITAARIVQHTRFLLATGALGISQNAFVAGKARLPSSYGLPVTFQEVICESRVMDTLFKVEEAHPRVGRSVLETFFPGHLRGSDKSSLKILCRRRRFCGHGWKGSEWSDEHFTDIYRFAALDHTISQFNISVQPVASTVLRATVFSFLSASVFYPRSHSVGNLAEFHLKNFPGLLRHHNSDLFKFLVFRELLPSFVRRKVALRWCQSRMQFTRLC